MPAKEFLDNKYPNRHTLIVGNSNNSLPTLHNFCKLNRFDLIFVDGGHQYEVARLDMDNIQSFAHKDTIIVLDDVCRLPNNVRHYTEGPTKVWDEFLSENRLIELGQHEEDGKGRGCVWGKFNSF